ncbi:MAG: iron export ABC transporter permease subunit FetB [Salinisphaera sp.]|nr:iron export ABC transporter permease subunit FetB [Salinisphaera sp.]MDN5939184.1 iron export ABC transporter permease subunit FetB [Salinisphaera sp.]
MSLITLSAWDLALAACLILALAATGALLRLSLARWLVIAALRTAVQLALVGLVLEAVFALDRWWWVLAMGLAMLVLAGREAYARQQRRYTGVWGYGPGTMAMFLSCSVTLVLALAVMIDVQPWYAPRYAIPLLGMLLGNTMTGVSLGLDRLTRGAWQDRAAIEARLALGQTAQAAIAEHRRAAVRTGMIPMINAMAAAGVVSLPGMMTGQILAGAPPWEAVKYQILIMFLITAATGFGTVAAVWLGARRLFDPRERLRLDRLR